MIKIAELTWAQVAATSQLQAERQQHQQHLQAAANAYNQLNGEYTQAEFKIQKAEETWENAKIEHHSIVSRMEEEAQSQERTIGSLRGQSESHERTSLQYKTKVENQSNVIAQLRAALKDERQAKENAEQEAASLRSERDTLKNQYAEAEQAVAHVHTVAYPKGMPVLDSMSDPDVDMTDDTSNEVVKQCHIIGKRLETLAETKALLDSELCDAGKEIKQLEGRLGKGDAAATTHDSVGDVNMGDPVPYPTPQSSRSDNTSSSPTWTPVPPSTAPYSSPETDTSPSTTNPLLSSFSAPPETNSWPGFDTSSYDPSGRNLEMYSKMMPGRVRADARRSKGPSAPSGIGLTAGHSGVKKARSQRERTTNSTGVNRRAIQKMFGHGDPAKFQNYREAAVSARPVEDEPEEDEVEVAEEKKDATEPGEEEDEVDPAEEWVERDRLYDKYKYYIDNSQGDDYYDQCGAAIDTGLPGTVWWNGEATSMLYFSKHYKKEHMIMTELKTTPRVLASPANPYLPYVAKDIDAENRKDGVADPETGEDADDIYGFSLQCALAHVPGVHSKALEYIQGSNNPISEADLSKFVSRLIRQGQYYAEDNDGDEGDWGRARTRAVAKLAGLSEFREALIAWANNEPSEGKWCWPPTFTNPEIARKTSITAEGNRKLNGFCTRLSDGLDLQKSIDNNNDDDISKLTNQMTTKSDGEQVRSIRRPGRSGVEGMYGPSKQ